MDNQIHLKTGVQQRKEVFISDRMIGFQHTGLQSNGDSLSKLLSGKESPEEIELLIHDFLLGPGVQPLILQSEDCDASWSSFLKNFEVVEAAGGVVLDEHGRLLMIHRYGKWDLPKGKLESGEDLLEGARREVIEECGIRIERLIRPLAPSHHTYIHKGRKCLKRTHWFLFVGNGTPFPQAEEGIVAAEWLDPTQVKQALRETYASILRVITHTFPGGEYS